ncbi:MAG: F0F1 ATP synthase subunit epsilon [Anaerolineae bacterium]|jgi:F-type H+-transporting ATPase subunit epsilon
MSEELAAPERLQLIILTPDQVLYRGPVLWVQVPLQDGLLGVWPGHAPLIGPLGHGRATYDTGDGIHETRIAGGTLRVEGERCSLLVSLPEVELEEMEDSDRSLALALEAALAEHLTEEELASLQESEA